MTPEQFMREAISHSRQGFPAPNPHVGCVIVRDDRIVGTGFHDHAGDPHAERVALAAAGSEAEGSDVYVSLEPCNHYGRTSPCTEALIEARVGRVFVACPDPNLRATGGADKLREAGIPVQMGLLKEEAAAANFRFLTAMREERVHVTVKAACSLDGRIALPSGESKWITGQSARDCGHGLRASCGAVLVGYRTVLADDPELTARIPGVVNQPLRIVIDPDNRLTGHEKVFNDEAETLHVTGRPVDLLKLTHDLFHRGQIGLLVEGGGRTIARFFESRLVDLVELFVAPKILGDGPAWVDGLGIPTIDQAPVLRYDEIERLGEDLHITATPIWHSEA
jgi:diaminohydroxyphosphoribosylaminopyrimidine deaminase/5-amino-6-(5-phosphoribosylamino)uracil reductase